MDNLKKKVESFMNDSGEGRSFPLERLLYGLSFIYGKAMEVRENLYHRSLVKSGKLPCMVISIGNITVGGTGKTPMTIYLARLIQNLGYRPAIVSRGYGGEASKHGGIVSNGKDILLDAEKAGDEPFMMASKLKGVPVVVGSRRYQAGMIAVKEFSPDIILLDDGFQHKKLQRDLDILLMDGSRPFGNNHILPRGTLRGPVRSIKRAGIFVLTRTSGIKDPIANFYDKIPDSSLRPSLADTPVFATSHSPHVAEIVPATTGENLSGKKDIKGLGVFAFSGIAKNYHFRKSVENLGGLIHGYLEFPDHYSYQDPDFRVIAERAIKSGAQCIVTTEKDYVRIGQRFSWPLPLCVLGVDIFFGNDKERFHRLIETKIRGFI